MAMGLINTLSQLGVLLSMKNTAEDKFGNKAKISSKDIANAKELFKKANSISAMASKYIVEYPTLISENVSEYDKALNIAKYIETKCAEFIILASGLTPTLETQNDNSISNHLGKFGHSFEGIIEPLSLQITDPTNDERFLGNTLYSEVTSKSTSYESLSSTKSSFSKEATLDVHGDNDNEWVQTMMDNDYDESLDPDSARSDSKKTTSDGPSFMKDVNPNDNKKEKKEISEITNNVTISKLIERLNKVPPTIINLNMKLDNGNTIQDVSLPLVIKSRMHYISNDEMVAFLEDLMSSNNKMLNFLKMTTGEISFLKDFVLRMNSVKRDIKTEKKLGRYPFFRELMDKKNAFKLKKILRFVPKFKSMVDKQDIMPTCTLIITKSELENATKMKFSYLLNNQKHIKTILDALMLLGLGIYDEINDIIHFYFNGVKDSEIIKMSDLGKQDSSDSNKLITELIKLAGKR